MVAARARLVQAEQDGVGVEEARASLLVALEQQKKTKEGKASGGAFFSAGASATTMHNPRAPVQLFPRAPCCFPRAFSRTPPSPRASHPKHSLTLPWGPPFYAGMGAGVAELKEQLAAVNVQLATAAESAELLEQKAALEAELKAAQAKKSADSAAAGAYGLFCSCHARPPTVSPAPSPARPPRPTSHPKHFLTLLRALPFMQAPRRRTTAATRSR